LLISDVVCRFSPAIGALVLLVLALLALVLWGGGAIETVRIPRLFARKLTRPVVLPGSRAMPYVAAVAIAAALGLSALQVTHACVRCDGLPGETAWVYAGEFNPLTKKFTKGEFVAAEKAGVLAQNIGSGSWITLKDSVRTTIVDYDKTGLARASDSPLTRNATISATCRKLPVGQRLYVTDKQTADAGPGVRNIWLRVRLSPPGMAPPAG
jgi:Na+-transporting methylmalonyl-CoA/oxaloacetate decarboxylase gamma subunit